MTKVLLLNIQQASSNELHSLQTSNLEPRTSNLKHRVRLEKGEEWLRRFEEGKTRVGVTLIRPRLGSDIIVGRLEWRPGGEMRRKDLGEALVRSGRGVVNMDMESDASYRVENTVEQLRDDAEYVEKLSKLEESDDKLSQLEIAEETVGRVLNARCMQHAQQQQQQQIQQQALQQNAAMMQQQLQQQEMQQMQAGAAQQQQYQQQMAAQQQYQQQLKQQQQLQAQQQQQMQAIQQQEQTPQGGSVMGTDAKGVGGVAIMGGFAGGAMLATNPEMIAGAGAIAGDLAGNAGELVGGVGEAAGDLLGGGLGEAAGGLVANAGEALSGLGNMLGF